MKKKASPKKPPAKKAGATGAGNRSRTAQPEIEQSRSLLTQLDRGTKGEERLHLFKLAAERVKTCLLWPDEAELIASWFEAIAKGESPKKVLFGETRGRPKGVTTTKIVKGKEVQLPNHFDLVFMMKQAIADDHSEADVVASFARKFDHEIRYIQGVFDLLKEDVPEQK